MGATHHAFFTGQVGRPARSRRSCRLAAEWGATTAWEIALLGRSFRSGPGAGRRTDYVDRKLALLAKHNLSVVRHLQPTLVGQAVCDHPIDERPPGHPGRRPFWGDGEPSGVRGRARRADEGPTARAARPRARRCATVGGFTGLIDLANRGDVPAGLRSDDRGRGYQDFADKWNPDPRCVRRGSAVRFAQRSFTPSEGSRTTTGPPGAPWTRSGTGRAFGLKLGPVALRVAGPRPGQLHPSTSADRIYHVDCKDAKVPYRRTVAGAG